MTDEQVPKVSQVIADTNQADASITASKRAPQKTARDDLSTSELAPKPPVRNTDEPVADDKKEPRVQTTAATQQFRSTPPEPAPASAAPDPLAAQDAAEQTDPAFSDITYEDEPAKTYEEIDDLLSHEPINPGSRYSSGTIVLVLVIASLLVGSYYFFKQQILGLLGFFVLLAVLLASIIVIHRILKLFIKGRSFEGVVNFIYIIASIAFVIFALYWTYFSSATVTLVPQKSTDTLAQLDSEIVLKFSKPVFTEQLRDTLLIQPPMDYEIVNTGLLGSLPAKRSFTLRPSQNWSPNTTYTLSLPGQKDIFGRNLRSEDFDFSTINITSTQSPSTDLKGLITSTSPQDQQEDVYLDADIVIKFDEEIAPATFLYSIAPAILTETTWVSTQEVKIVHEEKFQTNTRYSIFVQKNLRTANEQTMDQDYEFSFVTAPQLEVRSSSPKQQATSVSVNSKIEIVLNQPVLNFDDSFTISPAIAGHFSSNENIYVFTPDQTLTKSTQYKITLTPELTGNSGSTLSEPYTMIFETEKPAQNTNDEPAEPDTAPEAAVEPDTTGEPDTEDETPEESDETPDASTGKNTPVAQDDLTEQLQLESEFLDILNQQRQNGDLSENISLYNAAQDYAVDIVKHGYLGRYHLDSSGKDTSARMQSYGIDPQEYSEMIYAYVQWNPDEVLASWVRAKPALLTLDYNFAGICVLSDDEDNFIAVLLVAKL